MVARGMEPAPRIVKSGDNNPIRKQLLDKGSSAFERSPEEGNKKRLSMDDPRRGGEKFLKKSAIRCKLNYESWPAPLFNLEII